jgi:hypothetical protein
MYIKLFGATARKRTVFINIVLDLQFIPEDGGNIFLRILGEFLWNYSLLHSTRENFSH